MSLVNSAGFAPPAATDPDADAAHSGAQHSLGRSGYEHLFVSPHLDDAALSCGGLIHALSHAGRQVMVVTVCAGLPDLDTVSPYARKLHDRWRAAIGGREDPLEVRRAEDRAALELLGADCAQLDFHDAIYRGDIESRSWFYEDAGALFGNVRYQDWSTAGDIADALGALSGIDAETRVYVPLAIGHHVDHQLVRAAVESWRGESSALIYYEDFPYAADETWVVELLLRDGASRRRPSLQYLSDADIAAKIAALRCYQSQLTTFWRDETDMATVVRAFAHRRGTQTRPAERYWLPRRSGVTARA